MPDLQPTSDKLTVQKIVDAYTMLETRFSTMRRHILRNYRYVIGDQLDHDIESQLQAEHRPALIFNLIQPLIVFLAGSLSSNRQAMKATPTRFGDELLAELHSVLVSDFAMNNCDGYEEIVKAAIDAVIAKVGWVNNYWSTRTNPEGEWITESFDPLMVLWDPDGRKEDQTDWRYQCISGMYGAEEIVSIFAEEMSEEMKDKVRAEARKLEGAFRRLGTPYGWLDRVQSYLRETWDSIRGAETVRDTRSGLISNFFDGRTGLYRVVEWHEKRTIIRKWIYSAETRDKIQIPPEKSEDQVYIQQELAKFPGGQMISIPEEQLWVIPTAPALLPNDVIFEKPYKVQGKGFQHKPIFCYSFHPNLLETASIADVLISPQDSYNQRRMTMLEYIMDTVNPSIDAPKESIAPEDLDDWKSKGRGVIRFFKNTVAGKPEPRVPTVDKQALQVFAEEDRDLVTKSTGITPNLQGYSETSNEPASLYSQRVRQGQVMMSYFNSHVLRAMRSIFRYCDANLQQFLTFPRMVRLLSEPPEGMPGVQKINQGKQDTYWMQVNWPTLQGIVNDVRQGEYDFRPDFTQLGETARQTKFAEALAFIKTVPPQLVDWGALFELWDSPIAEKMAQFAKQMQGAAARQREQQLKAQEDQARLAQAAAEAGLIWRAHQQLNPAKQAEERVGTQ